MRARVGVEGDIVLSVTNRCCGGGCRGIESRGKGGSFIILRLCNSSSARSGGVESKSIKSIQLKARQAIGSSSPKPSFLDTCGWLTCSKSMCLDGRELKRNASPKTPHKVGSRPNARRADAALVARAGLSLTRLWYCPYTQSRFRGHPTPMPDCFKLASVDGCSLPSITSFISSARRCIFSASSYLP